MSEIKQIHHIRTVHTFRFVEDEQGMMQRKPVERFVKSDIDRITHSDGEVYEVHPDASFYVPVDVAAFYCRQPGWDYGPSPFEPEHVPAVQPPAPVVEKPREAPRPPASEKKGETVAVNDGE